MDNAGNSSQPQVDLNKPIPFESDPPKPVAPPPAPAAGPVGVSRAPLTLGGPVKPAPPPQATPTTAATPHTMPTTAAAPKVITSTPIAKKPSAGAASSDRISGVKTFYTKLHPGAIEFLDDQINGWLKENPAVAIKHTTVSTGEVQAKKTEPNIIINIWY